MCCAAQDDKSAPQKVASSQDKGENRSCAASVTQATADAEAATATAADTVAGCLFAMTGVAASPSPVRLADPCSGPTLDPVLDAVTDDDDGDETDADKAEAANDDAVPVVAVDLTDVDTTATGCSTRDAAIATRRAQAAAAATMCRNGNSERLMRNSGATIRGTDGSGGGLDGVSAAVDGSAVARFLSSPYPCGPCCASWTSEQRSTKRSASVHAAQASENATDNLSCAPAILAPLAEEEARAAAGSGTVC